jgi:uncharacterized protein YacL
MGNRSFGIFFLLLIVSGAFGMIFFRTTEGLLKTGAVFGPNSLAYLTLIGVLFGCILAAPLVWFFRVISNRINAVIGRASPKIFAAAIVGATIALIPAVLIDNFLAQVPTFTWYWSALIALTLVSTTSWLFATYSPRFNLFHKFNFHRFLLTPEPVVGKVLDTSAIIDSRIKSILDANFLEPPLLLPHFILQELQHLADSAEPLKRQRARRGLDLLDKLFEQGASYIRLIHPGPSGTIPVDDQLVSLCVDQGLALITTDYNLSHVAKLNGVRVLNVNELATAIRDSVVPGDRLSLTVAQRGRRPKQGIAFLSDGTMVVIEDAATQLGSKILAVVTRNLQTDTGRMIFARRVSDGDRLDTPSG